MGIKKKLRIENTNKHEGIVITTSTTRPLLFTPKKKKSIQCFKCKKQVKKRKKEDRKLY